MWVPAAPADASCHRKQASDITADSALVQVCFGCHQASAPTGQRRTTPGQQPSIPPFPTTSEDNLYRLLQQLKNGNGSRDSQLMTRLLRGYTDVELRGMAKTLVTQESRRP